MTWTQAQAAMAGYRDKGHTQSFPSRPVELVVDDNPPPARYRDHRDQKG